LEDFPALQIALKDLIAIPVPVGGYIQLDVMVLNLIIDGLFALHVRRGARISVRGRRENQRQRANSRQRQSASQNHKIILPFVRCVTLRVCFVCGSA
jgi:hypothetical protein